MDAAPLLRGGYGPDDADVPAAVICAACGRSDCAGCAAADAGNHRSTGTPWEERDVPRFRRLWRTAVMATVDGEAFFGGLGEGSVGAAFRFALLCELFAIASLAALWAPVSYVLVPGFVESVFWGEGSGLAIIGVVLAIPVLALSMVLLHVLWGTSLEFGLRLSGAEPRAGHCIRYALYSCGWDLVTSPFGFTAGCLSNGFRGATREFRAAVRIPRFATRAYVGQARRLPDGKARRALVLAAALTGAVVLAAAVALGLVLVSAMVEL